MNSKVRTRFAPSPTGFLHVGGLRTALYNYLFAKQNGGKFILRIEDTDRARTVEGAEKNIIETLRIFGLGFDEGPIRQSDNLAKYKKYSKELVAKGAAYEDDSAVRFKMPKDGVTVFADIIHGEIQIDNKTQEDFVILKSDGFPTYNLAHLVDDHDMAITHVIRGDEFISSMPKYIALHKAFGWELPQYAHLPLLLDKNRAKLSKREGEVAVHDFLDDGYLKEAVLNFVALLGWHSKTDQEIFSLEELIKEFKLERVQRAGAIFDTTKLDWMNGEYIQKKPLKDLVELSRGFFQFSISNFQFSNEYLKKIIALEQPRLKKLSELPEKTNYFFKEPEYDATLLKWKNMDNKEIKKSLETSKEIISNFQFPISKHDIEKIFLERAKKFKDRGELLWPLRVALTGKKASPGPFEIMEILGKEKSIARVASALNMLKPR
ncbi:MAG: glutamate--tRNA ligase [Candidatus Giovannonibacteria bacterium]|nr:MAG: glutamate--tRNA ligase [Candidatus Giovannonibacteria bacterium]